jgi:hypothetical protein
MEVIIMSESTKPQGHITLTYLGAVVSVLLALAASSSVIASLMAMWTNTGMYTAAGSALLLGSDLYTSTVSSAVAAAVFAFLAFWLYKKTTKDIASQPEYVHRAPYAFVTNTFVGILALTVILLASSLVSILISSLMLIGTSADIGQMYLQRFLPQLFGLGFVGFIGYCSYSIYRGKNMSKLMTLVLMGVAGALLVATLITVPIKAHTGSSNSSSNSRSSNYSSLYDY